MLATVAFGIFVIPAVALGLARYYPVPSAPPGTTVTMNAQDWNILYSPGMPSHPETAGGGWQFDFPAPPGEVHYVAVPVNMAASSEVRATFRITTTGRPVFNYKLDPGNTCNVPAHVRLYLQRRGDDLTRKKQFHRWFSNVAAFKLGAGSVELVAPLSDPAQWTSVLGKKGDHSEEARVGFLQALQNLGNVGFVFGGGCFYGHGVNVLDGTARFIVDDYSVR